jgi:hypothetical protein
VRLALIVIVASACSSAAPPPPAVIAATPAAPAATRAAPPSAIPMSQPAEYDLDHVSRDAGRAIFTRTGIGDPYRTGIPYPIFLALLRAFPDTFGADTGELAHRFGFVPRAADPSSADLDEREGLPIGMHLTVDPITSVPFVVTACALCHAERLRWSGGEATVIGLANKRVQIHAYDAAFADVTKLPHFTATRIGELAAAAAAEHHVAWPDAYADALVTATLDALVHRAADRAALRARTTAAPPGRVATIESFVPVLAQLAGQTVDFAATTGWAKVPDVIGFGQRTTLSWDSSGEGPMDLLAVEADVAAGVRVAWIERHPLQGASLGAYLRQPEPRPAFPLPIDRKLAARGRALFVKHCTDCHGSYADDGHPIDYEEKVIALVDIGTDPARARAATDAFERAANDPALTRGFTKFHRTGGYVPPVLTNVWARAPYGHAGQWPSLAILATPPERRPARVVIDFDAPYDLAAVGVATRSSESPAGSGAYVEDATRPGLTMTGHPFLAALGADSAAVIEYLKTL